MVSTVDFEATAPATPRRPWTERIVKRRVHITFIIFAIVVIWSLAAGVQPHDLTNAQDVQSWAGLALVLAGLAIRSWAAGTLHKHAELTTVGPYSLVRNPLYIGSMLMMVGFCILIGQGRVLWMLAGPFLLLFLGTVKHEERLLSAQFGAAWQAYAASTPRFIPRTLLVRAGNWSVKQWRKNREYQAVAATALGLVCLQLWQQL